MACIYEIYLDVLFVNNFLMDVLNLFLTGIFLRNPIHKGRILLAALFGSCMGVIGFLLLSSYGWYRLIMYVPVPVGMVAIAFLSRSLLIWVRPSQFGAMATRPMMKIRILTKRR